MGRLSNLCSLDNTVICLGEPPHIWTEIREVAEQPQNQQYFKISLYFLFLHLSKNLMYFSFTLWLKQTQHILAAELAFIFPQPSACTSLSQFSLSVPLTNGKEQMSKCIYLERQVSLIYLYDKCGPSLCKRARHWKREPSIDRAVCLHLCTESVHPRLQLQASN